jgi:predicted metal-dependent hydrolase
VYEKYRKKEEESPESFLEIFPDREYILFLGEKYPFHIQHHTIPYQTWISFKKNHFEIKTDQNDSGVLRAALSNWYLKVAEEILPPLVKAYATAMKLPVPDLEYSSVKTRWAVCYPTRNLIRFNILILKAPPDCIEYLVMHELSHFYVSSHNKAFWEIISRYMPDYHERKKILATYRAVL